jgi:hypothetical protein
VCHHVKSLNKRITESLMDQHSSLLVPHCMPIALTSILSMTPFSFYDARYSWLTKDEGSLPQCSSATGSSSTPTTQILFNMAFAFISIGSDRPYEPTHLLGNNHLKQPNLFFTKLFLFSHDSAYFDSRSPLLHGRPGN